MENLENGDKKSYISILRKIKHKPHLIEGIFPFMIKNPYIFFNITEKDKKLKEKLQSFFFQYSKSQKENFNENIKIFLFYKVFFKIFYDFHPDYHFFQFLMINAQKINEKTNDMTINSGSLNSIIGLYLFDRIYIDIFKSKNYYNYNSLRKYTFKEILKIETTKLFYFPKTNVSNDGWYIEEKLINKNKIKDIECLMCIIDKNNYFISVKPFDNIKIKKLIFIILEKDIEIDILSAMEAYLDKLEKNKIEEIFFVPFEQDNNYTNFIGKILLDKKTLNISILKKLTIFPKDYFKKNYFLYFSLSLLFKNTIIDGILVINSFNYININQKIKIKPNVLIIKIDNLLILDNRDFLKKVNSCITKDCPTIFYFSGNLAHNSKTKSDIDFQFLISELNHLNTFVFYSETPLVDRNNYLSDLKIDDINGNFIILEKNAKISLQEIEEKFKKYSFLLKKYEILIAYDKECRKIHYIADKTIIK